MRTLFLLTGLILFSACSEEEKNSEVKTNSPKAKQQKNLLSDRDDTKSYWEYFYPIDSIEPYILAYQDNKNPIDEKLHRFISMKDEYGDSVLIIERYNSNFRIFEGFTLDIKDSFNIIDHMMVDKDGIKRSSRLKHTEYFPKNRAHQAVFLADFPSHLDSVIMFYESKKHIDEVDLKVDVLGKEREAISVIDSITVRLVNLEEKKENVQRVVSRLVFAKNFGLVRFHDLEKETDFELKRVFSDAWWMEYAM